jgi:NADPH-dependent ferric siderophore reductase
VRLAEQATVTILDGRTIVENRLGRAELVAVDGYLRMRAEGNNDCSLSVVKMALAEQVLALAEQERPAFVWTGHDSARRDLPYLREMTVRRAWQVTPRMRRVVLGGDISGLDRGGLHVRLLIPPRDRVPVWPYAAADGRTVWPDGDDTLTSRVYTIRWIDPSAKEIAIDVVLHPGCVAPGSAWAEGAQASYPVGILGPGGGDLDAADWYLLAGDETALPAIARMLDMLPASARAIVRIEVADREEEQPLRSMARVDLRWLHRNGAAAGTTSLLEDAVLAVEWPCPEVRSYAWIACEQAAARNLRAHFDKRCLDRQQRSIAAHWRRTSVEPGT